MVSNVRQCIHSCWRHFHRPRRSSPTHCKRFRTVSRFSNPYHSFPTATIHFHPFPLVFNPFHSFTTIYTHCLFLDLSTCYQPDVWRIYISFAANIGGSFGNPEPEMMAYEVGIFSASFWVHAHIDTKQREPFILDHRTMDWSKTLFVFIIPFCRCGGRFSGRWPSLVCLS